MRAHRDGMNAGVGAPGAEHLRILGGEAVDRFLDRLLDAGAVRLPLPAHKGAAVIFDGEGEAGHGGPLSRSCRAKSRHPEGVDYRSEEHTSELQSLMRISYAVFCLKKKK